ncbi:60S ribosomal protein L7a [Fukomys damarensis]|uniref:60S ribosomal protein L7a n=2 Tax=Fukomys damarensis TaxID=885580 RepID=A0A091DJN7_FUKDA|nr:60S ribosomal protein L7a [Fukomys damarensis]
MHAAVAFMQVNLETKALVKLMEAVRTNCNDRYDEICHQWKGKVLGPKPVACFAKLEMVKARELAIEVGKIYSRVLSILYIE